MSKIKIKNGFTLIEMLVIVVVMSIIITIGYRFYLTYIKSKSSKNIASNIALDNIKVDANLYSKEDNNIK